MCFWASFSLRACINFFLCWALRSFPKANKQSSLDVRPFFFTLFFLFFFSFFFPLPLFSLSYIHSLHSMTPTILFTLPPTIFAVFHALKFVEGVLAALGRTWLAARVKAFGTRDKDGYRMAANFELAAVLVVILNIFRRRVLFCSVFSPSFF